MFLPHHSRATKLFGVLLLKGSTELANICPELNGSKFILLRGWDLKFECCYLETRATDNLSTGSEMLTIKFDAVRGRASSLAH